MIKVVSYLYDERDTEPILRIDTSHDPSFGKLVSFNLGNLDRGDHTDTIAWGIYSNTGSISFILPKTATYLFKDDVDFSYYKFKFVTVDNQAVPNKESLIATFYVKDFKYNRETYLVEVELTDRLEDWQNINVNINISNMEFSYYANLKYVYNTVYEKNPHLPTIDTVDVEDLFSKIFLGYEHRVSTMSFWDFINEICSLTATRVIADKSGFSRFFIGNASETFKVFSKDIFSINPICAKRHNSISSVKIGIPRKINLEPVTSSFTPDRLTFGSAENYVGAEGLTYTQYPFSYSFKDTSAGRAKKINVISNNKNANILKENSLRQKPNNLLWKYGAPGDQYNGEYTFHDRDNGYIASISFSDDDYGDIYVTSLSGRISSYEYRLILNQQGTTWAGDVDPAQIPSLEIYGNVISDGGDDSQTRTLYSNGTNNIKLNSSPWIYIAKIVNTETTLYDWLFDKVSKFAEGRNCLEIECALDNYYDGKGNLKKTRGVPFSRYDVIIPYIKKKGEQKPYLGTDKNPMKFIVTGVEYSYKGHFVQKLYLQEYIED